MKKWQIYLTLFAVALSACASTPAPNPWEGLETETEQATTAIDCGSFPMPSEAFEAYVVYDVTGLNALEAYRACSEANEANVDEHSAQISQLKLARKGLVEAGQAQYNISLMLKEMMEEERKNNFWQKLGWAAIAIAGVAL